MSGLIQHDDAQPPQPLRPVEPRLDFTIRTATMDDFDWIDAMQKAESDKLGFLMRAAIQKRIEQGNVLVAEATGKWSSGPVAEWSSDKAGGSGPVAQWPRDPVREGPRTSPYSATGPLDHSATSSKHSATGPLGHSATAQAAQPLGYCIAVDRYMKQDHVGQFIQLNVPPEYRRSLVGAALVKATFEKSAYGVKLYGLWCRQDLAANRFWESLGFVPLAFRAAGVSNLKKGSRGRGAKGASDKAGGSGPVAEWPSDPVREGPRTSPHSATGPRDHSSTDPSAATDPPQSHDPRTIHIYWQRRVRKGDNETPHWFPYETSGGMMAESRLVLPIPLGTHWSDAKPVVLPGAERRAAEARLLEAKADEKHEQDKAALAAKRKEARDAAKEAKRLASAPKVVHGVEITSGAAAGVPMGFDLPPEAKAQRDAEEKQAQAAAEKARIKEEKRAAKREAKQQRRRTDPELLAYSRELRDRWQEAVTAQPGLLLPPGSAPGSQGAGKYDVSRLIAGPSPGVVDRTVALEIVSEVVPDARRLDAA
ncbi:hypothetical protein OT109_18675 [Phycisphaeraceae bacterium D3-23]